MSDNVVPLPTTPRAVEIRVGDKVEHKKSGIQGFAFKVEDNTLTVLRLGETYDCDISEWRPV